jgi:hypothetical protein
VADCSKSMLQIKCEQAMKFNTTFFDIDCSILIA